MSSRWPLLQLNRPPCLISMATVFFLSLAGVF